MKRCMACALTQVCVVGALMSGAGVGPALAADPAATETVKVSGFQVTGNTLLDPKVVDAVLMPVLGQRSLDELQRAATAVQALYAQHGYGAVVAYLPPQTGHDGLITIAVVEGKLKDIEVTGANRFSADNIRASLPALKQGTTPRLREIDAQLRIANENPAKQVQVLLKPGKAPGEADVEVLVQEHRLQRFMVGLDNTGNDRTGNYRASLGWQHASITGHDDVIGAQLQFSPTEADQVRVLSAGYRWPFYAQRMVFDAFAAYSDVDAGTTASIAGDLRFVGKGRVFGVRAGWYLPRWGEFDPRLTVGFDQRAYLNRCDIDGLPSGACGPAGQSVGVSPLQIEYALQSGGATPMSFSVSVSHNLRLGGSHTDRASFEAIRPDAKPAYTALRFGLSGAFSPAEEWLLRGRLTGQWTPDALVSGEQFGFGGAQSVRGYEERELIGDIGLAASVELSGPLLLAADSPLGSVRPLAFVDAGVARNQGDAPCYDLHDQCAAASVGVGLRYARGTFSARLDLAYPLMSVARTQRGDTRAHLALQIGF
jgi:hemolysin activation/secretion protein